VTEHFGKWTVLKFVPNHARIKGTYAECRCECGKQRIVNYGNLIAGLSKSCGCSRRESNTKHGLRYHPLYQTYRDMLRRCFNPKSSAYADYGERGITVCKRWLGEKGIYNFIKWADNLPDTDKWRPGLSIERMDNNGNYEPDNCYFATWKEQGNNRRSCRYFKYHGKLLTVSEIARINGVKPNILLGRLDRKPYKEVLQWLHSL